MTFRGSCFPSQDLQGSILGFPFIDIHFLFYFKMTFGCGAKTVTTIFDALRRQLKRETKQGVKMWLTERNTFHIS